MYNERMKRSLWLSTVLVLLGLVPCAAAVTDDRIKELEGLHRAAESLIVENRFREAIDLYTDIILLEPDDEVAYTNLGNAYLVLGDMGRARRSYEAALNINPDDAAAASGLARILDPDRPAASQDSAPT